MKYKIKRIIYVILAFIFFIIGFVGVILPVLPTTHFYYYPLFSLQGDPIDLTNGFYLQIYIKIT